MTRNTIDSKFGDVVLVPFPFTDQTASKKRPAIVVSSDAYHRARPDVILVAVTSQTATPAIAIGDLSIEQWGEAGLLKPSLIKPIFTTVEQGLIVRRLGALQARDLVGLREILRQLIG